MRKGYKIAIIVLAAVLFCGAVGYAVASKVSRGGEETTTAAGEGVSTTEGSDVGQEQASTTAAPETTAANMQQLLLGKWTDGANMSGFEFFEGGRVTVTYVNVTIPILNLPVNGSYDGTYTVNGDKLTTSFSIYTATIKDIYTFTIDDNTLTLRNAEDGKTSTYMKREQAVITTSADESTAPAHAAVSGDIIGSWISSDGKIKYRFKSDGSFTVIYSSVTSSGVPAGTYSGVFILEDDSLTVQYTANTAIVEKYTCSPAKNMLTLLDSSGISRSFTREGTGFDSSAQADDLLGKWMDGANVSGFEFSDSGVVTVTYVNVKVPVVNIPITGTYDGSYTVNGNSLSMTYSIYGSVMRKTYTFSVSGNTLTLTDAEDGKVTAYVKK